ncbi:MAG: hypothetical protein UZ17_ACD001001982 [Acidobacteria bacterium OLB17]|nr:MAG: hypothetical protein UZ17_ACD001001982 [Acidobacteria bacterium OLB17]
MRQELSASASPILEQEQMQDLELFYNDGTGWACKQCERELGLEKEVEHSHARFFREGEAESKFLPSKTRHGRNGSIAWPRYLSARDAA